MSQGVPKRCVGTTALVRGVMARRTAMMPYLRTTLTLDKIKIIKEKPKGLEKLGVKVVQEEAFFLEPVKSVI